MNIDEINQRVRAIVIDKLGVESEDATDNAHFKDDLGADSLDLADLFMDLETSFSTTIPDVDWPELDTIGKVGAYLHERLQFV